MSKNEFLEELHQALGGEMSQGQVSSNLAYYNSYIEEETRKGKSEAQVLEELGSPRLIAKTLIETSGGSQQGNWTGYEESYDRREASQPANSDYQGHQGFSFTGFRARLVLIGILVAVIVVFVLVAVFLISLLPYLIPFLLLLLLFSFLFRRRR